MEESQEGIVTTPELTGADGDFIREFKALNNPANELKLRGYETKNRDRISKASMFVRAEFDRIWEMATGQPYYQPVTTAPRVAVALGGQHNLERGDPKGRRYRAAVMFSHIEWTMKTTKFGERLVDQYTVTGIETESSLKRQIYTNLDDVRLNEVLGQETALQILGRKNKMHKHGTVEINQTLEVEGFWEVEFSPQRGPQDPPDVTLPVDNLVLHMKRGKPVILPGFHIEAADHTYVDIYSEQADQDRKVIGKWHNFPYAVIRECNYAEYLHMVKEGTRETQKKHAEAQTSVD